MNINPKICRDVERERRRNPRETGLRDLRICPLWTHRKQIWMWYGKKQRFLEHELRECGKLNTWALYRREFMNKIADHRQLHYTNHQSRIAWKMITHKEEIIDNKRKQIHTSHCFIWNPNISSLFILSLNNSPKYVSQSTGSTIIKNYNKILPKFQNPTFILDITI